MARSKVIRRKGCSGSAVSGIRGAVARQTDVREIVVVRGAILSVRGLALLRLAERRLARVAKAARALAYQVADRPGALRSARDLELSVSVTASDIRAAVA